MPIGKDMDLASLDSEHSGGPGNDDDDDDGDEVNGPQLRMWALLFVILGVYCLLAEFCTLLLG